MALLIAFKLNSRKGTKISTKEVFHNCKDSIYSGDVTILKCTHLLTELQNVWNKYRTKGRNPEILGDF